MTMNSKGVQFIHARTRRLDVDTMDRAAEVIGKALAERDARFTAGKPLDTDNDLKAVGRHLAWLVGFDALTGDRKAINDFTSMLVGEGR